jgi:hypothetical protein
MAGCFYYVALHLNFEIKISVHKKRIHSFLTEMTKKTNIVLAIRTLIRRANCVFFPAPQGLVFSLAHTTFMVRR